MHTSTHPRLYRLLEIDDVQTPEVLEVLSIRLSLPNMGFPRLYVEPVPLPTAVYDGLFWGRRSEFGPCVTQYVETKENVETERHEIGRADWNGPDAANLARELLFRADCLPIADEERVQAFANEVVRKLPHDEWTLPLGDVRRWNERWYVRVEEQYTTRVDPDAEEELPGPEDDAGMWERIRQMPLPDADRIRERFRGLGMIDEGERAE